MLLLSACTLELTGNGQMASPSPIHTDPPADTDGPCIQPITNLAYPVGIPKPLDEEPKGVPPLGDWQTVSSLPESLEGYIARIATRAKEVWIAGFDAEMVFRYHTDTSRWQAYSSIDEVAAVPEDLYVSRDGTVWGIGVNAFGPESAPGLPLLSRYNETNDRFEFFPDVDGLLIGMGVLRNLPPISEDKTGMLWFFASKIGPEGAGDEAVGLYSFDPVSRKAEKHTSMMSGYHYTTPVVAPDGLIWFYNGQEASLYTYSPATGENRAFHGIPSFERIGSPWNLFFDESGNLWADNKGWLDFSDPTDPVWYEIIPSAAFLTDHGAFRTDDVEGPRSRYGFTPPVYIYQSSNGWMWFTTLDGTIRLDPRKEEWCRFTNGSSTVVEDDEGNVWISVFDKLYKYELGP